MKSTLAKIGMLASILAVSGLVTAQSALKLPDMGSTTTRVLSADDERTFARDFERYMRANNLLVEDPLIHDYFVDMGFRLVSHSNRPSSDFHFFIVNEQSINAFAAPAGVIGLHIGLLLAAHDESEVAGVVAHEVAHITQDHLARGLENAQQVSLPTMIATLGLALAAGMSGASPDATQAVLVSGIGLAHQFQINHTRQSEAEADRVGIGLLAAAGYDPQGMTRFFERLQSVSRSMGQGPPEYLRTHPLTVNRIAEARSRADQMAVREERVDERFHYVQSRLRAQSSNYPRQAEEFFRARISDQSRPESAMRYGLALTLIRDRRLDEAATEVEWLLERDPDRQLYRLLAADLAIARGNIGEGLAILEYLYRTYAGNRLVTTQYAEALMHERDPARAAQAAAILRQYLRANPNDLSMTQLYARAADRAGDAVRAAEALAESYYMRGGLDEAIIQLERVVARDDINYYQRARINARLEDFRSEQIRINRGRTSS